MRISKKILACVLAALMALTMMPFTALAEETAYGTIGLYQAGEATITGNGTANEKITIAHTALNFASKDYSVARYWDAYYMGGIKFIAPEGTNISTEARYTNGSVDSNTGELLVKNLYTARDGDNYMYSWPHVTEESLKEAVNAGQNKTWEYTFDWDGDGVFEQKAIIELVCDTITLVKDGEQVYPVEPMSINVAEVNGTQYATLGEAVAAANAGDTITLIADVVTDTPIVVAAGKDIKLDINGHNISGNIADSDGKKLIQVSGILEFVGNNGGCIYNTNVAGQGHAACQALTGGTIIVNSPIHFGDSDADMTNANAVNRGCGIQNNGGTLIINDGYFTAIDANYSTGAWAYAILNCAGETIVNNATVYGNNLHGALGSEEGTFTVNGGTFAVNGANNYYSLYGGGGDFIVNGGTFTNNSKNGVNYLGTGTEISITGGTFNYSSSTPFVQSSSISNPVLTGGTFSTDVTAYCADGYVCTENTGRYVVVPEHDDTMSITVADDVNLNININEPEAEYIVYKFSDPDSQFVPKEKEVTKSATGEVTSFTIPLAPAQIKDKITAEVYDENGYFVRRVETSVAEYCNTVIGMSDAQLGQRAEQLRDLARATLDYGKAAAEYFEYNKSAFTEDVILGDPTDDVNTATAAAVAANGGNTYDTSVFRLTGVSYVAKSEPELRFYITNPYGEDDRMFENYLAELNKAITCNIGKAQFVQLEERGTYLLQIRDIDICDFGKKIVVNGYTTDQKILEFTPLVWVKSAIGKADLVDLGKAIGNYYLKAVDYFTKNA